MGLRFGSDSEGWSLIQIGFRGLHFTFIPIRVVAIQFSPIQGLAIQFRADSGGYEFDPNSKGYYLILIQGSFDSVQY